MNEEKCQRCQGEIRQLYHKINKTGYCSWDCLHNKQKTTENATKK